MIYLELFWSFIQVGMFSVGGGYAAIPLIQTQAVELHNWLTMSQFTDLVTIAEMTPGPIAVNSATFVGITIAGFPGAIIATFGCILPSLILVSILAKVYYKYKNLGLLQNILGSLRPAVVALILSAGLKILIQVCFPMGSFEIAGFNWVGSVLFILAFLGLRIKKWNPILMMSLCGVANLVIGIATGAV